MGNAGRELQAKGRQVLRLRGESQLGTRRLFPFLEATDGLDAREPLSLLAQS